MAFILIDIRYSEINEEDDLNQIEHDENLHENSIDEYFDLEENSEENNENMENADNEIELNEVREDMEHLFANESDDPDSSEDSLEALNNSDSSDEDQQNENIIPEPDLRGRLPLYRGAPLTVTDSMLILLTILLHHNVTYSCLTDMITVINLHCLSDQLKKNSLFKFQKYFSLCETEFKKHYYCSKRLRPLESSIAFCPSCSRRKNSYFVELPFLEQLKEMYKRSEFFNDL